MSANEEKKTFVIKHTFTDVKNMKIDVRHDGKKEKHFSIPWNIYIFKSPLTSTFQLYLGCQKFRGDEDWSINTTINSKLTTTTGVSPFQNTCVYSNKSVNPGLLHNGSMMNFLVNGNLTVECHVAITKMNGINKIARSFNESKHSDVVLKVEYQKFHVCKMYLASQAIYFDTLLFGNFEESKQSEVELKDIEPGDFQNFLEVLHGEPSVEEDNIEGILQLADMYDAKTVIRQCEQFCLYKSKQDLKFKLNMAVKYNMDQLQKKCISELKTVEDINSVIPEDDSHFGRDICNQLMKLSISLHMKK